MKQNSILKVDDLKRFDELDYINSIWLAIMKMDYSLIGILLDNIIDYDDMDKQEFIEKLKDKFNDHKTLGDSAFVLDLDYCKGCNCNKPI